MTTLFKFYFFYVCICVQMHFFWVCAHLRIALNSKPLVHFLSTCQSSTHGTGQLVHSGTRADLNSRLHSLVHAFQLICVVYIYIRVVLMGLI
jgi:hypothetical protein